MSYKTTYLMGKTATELRVSLDQAMIQTVEDGLNTTLYQAEHETAYILQVSDEETLVHLPYNASKMVVKRGSNHYNVDLMKEDILKW